MPRYRLLDTAPEEKLRDYVVEAVRNDNIHPKQRDQMAREIERHWQLDPTRDRRIIRRWKAWVIEQELASMIASGTPIAKAKEALRARLGHNSVEAFDKWRRRNAFHWVRRRPITSR